MKATVVGATGAIGRELVKELLACDGVTEVRTVVRRPSAESHPKLKEYVVGFDNLPTEAGPALEGADAAFCCLGTTRKDAGKKGFIKVDLTYVSQFADLAKQAGSVRQFHLVSSTGASAGSCFLYMKVKGQAEDYVKGLGFESTAIYRPGLLARGDKARWNEKLGAVFMTAMPVRDVAQAMRITAEKFQSGSGSGALSVLANKQIWSAIKGGGQ